MGTITLTLYPQFRLAHLLGHGDISESMILGQLEQLPLHPDWQGTCNVLIDLGSAVVRRSPADNLSIKPWLSRTPDRDFPISKWAICTSDDTVRKLLEQRLGERDGTIVDIFHHRLEALRFLDLSPQHLTAAGSDLDDTLSR